MNFKSLSVMAPLLLLAFNYDNGALNTLYYNNLKLLKQADAPRNVRMIRTGHRVGQSTLSSDGVLFTYRSRSARSVSIAGSFSGWKEIPMDRSDNGIWYYFVPAGRKAGRITYKYLVDGIWIMDPLNPDRIDDRMGSYLSVAEPGVRAEGKLVSWRRIDRATIEFRTYRPGASMVSLVGDFNHWNPEHDLLTRGSDGIWRLRKKLYTGVYRYQYIIDGEWVPDRYNPKSGSDVNGKLCSVIEIKKH
ncbi:MAG: glycogen-binding domain-containing protein [Spirochaetes bacterium]|nr:glycogen-binding domain-containing protein [Spirochaetota bacterium]